MKKKIIMSEAISNKFESLGESLRKFAESFSRSTTALVEYSPKVLKYLAKEGWYIPFDTVPKLIFDLNSLIDEDNILQIDQCLIEYYDQELNFFIDALIRRFPHRADVIKQAVEAHISGKYYLSIPVFFSQTEGICKELTGKRFFGTKNNQPHTHQWVEKLDVDTFLQLFSDPLKEIGIARQKQNFSNPIGINRHDVLHGESVDYGTKLNSYKSLSLLIYIGDAVYLMSKGELK